MLLTNMGGGYGYILLMVLFIMFGPSIIMGVIAAVYWSKNKKKTAKSLAILAVVYQLISLGVCGALIYG